MATPPEILRLVEQFGSDPAVNRYNETQVRVDFINPFFEALGWDVVAKSGSSLAYREVVHEDTLKTTGGSKAPDYCFYLGGERKFFVEAKKPSVKLRSDPEPALQIRRYGWSAKLPLSVVTDFEEFAIYDCRIEPQATDKANIGQVHYIPYTEYDTKWEIIANLFSKEAVREGSLDKFIEELKPFKPITPVDSAFLKEISSWRETLARNIAERNPKLSQRDLNYAVQMTIDRILFLRICEARGIESRESLDDLRTVTPIYPRLCALFQDADDRFNSGLFHFTKEKGRDKPDDLSLKLLVGDEALREMLKRLYPPYSPYAFDVIPIEILGQVYEQFLGKVIRLDDQHKAVVEEKPEVRKAGGVYYTPTYIVNYIVKETVGRLLQGKTPAQASELRILDPACGSGSFLIGAHQYLLDWHLQIYMSDGPDKHKRKLDPDPNGGYRLSIAERKRILLNNIYGVDIDTQAVEVTKLSLLLKVLEGETERTLALQKGAFRERVLPDLEKNIKCGNSLIGYDFYESQQAASLSQEERARVNVFDWEKAFPEIMKAGGFDAVIGNPPYIRIQTMKEWAPLEVEEYKRRYISASKGNYDIYVVFVEKGLALLNGQGRLGFILPHKFFNAQYGEPLRGLLAKGKHLSHVVHFGDEQVFAGATTYTCLMFLDKGGNDQVSMVKVHGLDRWRTSGEATKGTILAEHISAAEWNFTIGIRSELFEKLGKMPVKLGDISHLFVGLQTDADDIFILEEVQGGDGLTLCRSKATGREHWFEDTHLKPFLKGSLNIRRYYLADATKRLIFPYSLIGNKSALISKEEYRSVYPLTWTYLEANEERLRSRNKGQMGQEWYGYVYKKNHTRFGVPKLLVPSIAVGSCFAYDPDGKYYFVGSGGGGGGGYGITINEGSESLAFHYLLGVLNSKLLSTHLKQISSLFHGGYIALNKQYIEQLPIRTINFSDPTDKKRHDRMVQLVEKMLELHKRLAATHNPHDREVAQREIEATDRQIDRLVYELYGLTEEEIKIVEGS